MKFICKAVFFIIVILFIPSRIMAGKLPETARLVPSETAVLLNVDDFSELRAQFEKTDIYGLYKDPAMAAFVEDAKEKLRRKASEKKNEILHALMDEDILPEGRVSFALVLNDKALEEDEPQALFVIRFGNRIAEVKELEKKVVRKAIEQGAGRKEEDYRGVSIRTVISDKERLGFGFSSSLSYCFIEDYLVGSEDIELVKFAIAHIQGAGSPSLADESEYSDAVGAIGPNHDITLYVNIKQIIKTVLAKDTTGKMQGMMKNLGFDNVVYACGAVDIMRSAECSWSGKLLIKTAGAKRGVCKILDVKSRTFKVPEFVPSNINSISFLNLDIKEAYNELSSILSGFSPQYAAILYMPLMPPGPDGEEGLDIKRDVIDHLGSQIVFASGIKHDISSAEVPFSAESLVAVEAENPRALEKSLSLLHNRFIVPNNPDARRELLGHTLYLVSIPSFLIPPASQTPMELPSGSEYPQMPILAFTVTDTHLIFGEETTVENVIRTMSGSEDASVGTTKWFRTAKSALPSVVGFAEMEDIAASVEIFWKMMKEGSEAAENDSNVSIGLGRSSLMGPFPRAMFSQTLFDMTLLPEFEVVRKYFGLSVNYMVSRPGGFLCEYKLLRAVEMD